MKLIRSEYEYNRLSTKEKELYCDVCNCVSLDKFHKHTFNPKEATYDNKPCTNVSCETNRILERNIRGRI